MTDKEFIEELKLLGITPTSEQLIKLEEYYNLLVEWNSKINLTRIIERKEVYLKHFYDSLTIRKIVDLNDYNTLCDIGTGAGFPGMVLKIFYPHLDIVLVDAREKKVVYIKDKLYMYADNIVLGATDTAVITWMKDPKHKKLLDLITKDTYPEMYSDEPVKSKDKK